MIERREFRKARRLVFSRTLWQKRLVFWCGAICIGLAASFLALLADAAQDMFASMIKASVLWPVLVTPLVFAVSAALTQKWFPAATGSGIPQAIAARILRDPASRKYLLGVRVVLGKSALTILGLLGGASIGREGPTVQIGAAILLLCASLGGLSAQRGVVLAGAAAGVAAAFNTPLAGIVFAIEEMARAFEHRNSSIILIAIVLSGSASMAILGNYSYFGYADVTLSLSRDWFCVVGIGVLGGICGGLFAVAMIHGRSYLCGLFGGAGERYPIRFAALCGLIVACIGLATHGVTYGTGYHLADHLLHGGQDAPWWQAPAKFLTTALSAISGIPGGIFSPSLSVGAAMGGCAAPWFSHTPWQGVILLAMVAYFAGVTQAPITAFVIVLEITGKGTMAVPLIAAAVIAAAVGRLFCPVSLYHALAKPFITQARNSAVNSTHPRFP